ncbi:MAG: GFA family protein [Myxococcota bacterium]|nr:GFA family protein [Myxococcota bacterium]
MQLYGSCHCRAVRFTVESRHPHPYQLCYCSICRKTQGGGGFAINLSGDFQTLRVQGKRDLRVYRALIRDPGDRRARRSTGQRHFCGKCGSALWLYDPTWPQLVHPFASAIDSPLPCPPQRTHLMLEFAPAWLTVFAEEQDLLFEGYPKESIAAWHQRNGVELPAPRKPKKKGRKS